MQLDAPSLIQWRRRFLRSSVDAGHALAAVVLAAALVGSGAILTGGAATEAAAAGPEANATAVAAGRSPWGPSLLRRVTVFWKGV